MSVASEDGEGRHGDLLTWEPCPHSGSRPAGLSSRPVFLQTTLSASPGRQLVQTAGHGRGRRTRGTGVATEAEAPRVRGRLSIGAKPRAVSGECWSARLFENRSSVTALKSFFLNQGKVALRKGSLVAQGPLS